MDPAGGGIAFRVLGTVDMTVGERIVEIGSAKQRALLAALLLRLNSVVPVAVLVDDLWGDDPPPAVQPTLQSLASRLRRAFGPGTEGACLRHRDGGYVLEATRDRVDAHRFGRLSVQGRSALAAGDAVRGAQLLDTALALWRGAAFGDLADRPFARAEAERLEEARRCAVEDLADALLATGRPQDALDRLEPHVAEHRLRERPWAQLMLALYRLDRQADALHAFRRVRRVLADELGVEPMPQLRLLAEQILHHAPTLTAPTDRTARGGHHLPVSLTSFVGRERELGEIVVLLGTVRLLTLSGAGGSGKTRLALRAAAEVQGRFPDGVCFVELASVSDPHLVTDQVVTAAGLLPDALVRFGRSLEHGLCEHLRDRRQLVVLDNCEHVVAAAAGLVHVVLARCPDVAVLATSREVLGVPGEVVWQVPPLSLPPVDASSAAELAGSDAVALFAERARAARPGFGVSAANAAAVARICRRLDGIPLGLELAAGKIRMLGAHQVAERLDDRFRLLTGGSRTAVPRHQTLQAAMDWSYRLLPAPEQAVLRRLAAFRGTFALDAAEAVVGIGASDPPSGTGFEVLGALTRLVDKSLVTVVSDEFEVRYALLETVREYAWQKLEEADDADATRTRHRDHYLSSATSWAATSGYWNWWWWLRRLVADHDNFAAALEWSAAGGDDDALLELAAAHWPYWYWGETLGWRRWLVAAVDRGTTPGRARVEALIALASLLRRSGEQPSRCEALFAQAREVALGLADGDAVAQVDFYRAHVLLSDGEPRAAEALVRSALASSTNVDFLGWCHWMLGRTALLGGRTDEAAAAFDVSSAVAEDVDDESLRAHVCAALAQVAVLHGDPDDAVAMADRAVRSAERMAGAPRVLMMALAHAGQVAALAGDGRAGATGARLLRLLRDRAVTDWADEALDIAGLVLAARSPGEAAAALCASRPLDHRDGRLVALRERLGRCRARLEEQLGSERWAAVERAARAAPVERSVGRALAALEETPM